MNERDLNILAVITGEMMGMLSRFASTDVEAMTYLSERGFDLQSLKALQKELRKLADVFYQ